MRPGCRARTLLGAAGLLIAGAAAASAEPALEREATIPLGDVGGRIDHLAIDLDHRRVFVAELGNDSVGVVDLDRRRVVQRITAVREPQGVAYLPTLETLVVASGKTGTVTFYAGQPLAPAGRVDLKDDADNVRVLPDGRSVVVGYGDGGLAVIDVAARAVIGDIRLEAHPEGFQIDPNGSRIVVNLPDARAIAVVDHALRRQVARWAVPDARANFPMVWLGGRDEIVSVFRSPARLIRFRVSDGAVLSREAACGDADDVAHDAGRDRLYVICGDGTVQVLRGGEQGPVELERTGTVPGARTGLFVPELDRLLVAVRAHGGEPAAIWIFKPR